MLIDFEMGYEPWDFSLMEDPRRWSMESGTEWSPIFIICVDPILKESYTLFEGYGK